MASLSDCTSVLLINLLENEGIRSGYRTHPINCFELPENKFVKLFRLNKCLADEFINKLSPFMTGASRSSAIDIEEKILCALRFFATGSYQQLVGESVNIGLSQPSVCRALNEVVHAVQESGLINEVIRFPSTVEELNQTRKEFYNKYSFPGVIGCIDCTHVAIFPPPKEDPQFPEHIYVNRKRYHSINVQIVCNANLDIISVNAKYPGSTHYSFIWNNSNVFSAMRTINSNFPDQYFLLGDSGYALRPWLFTPDLSAQPNTPERKYNDRQMSVRSIIERVNGVLKMRFRCLLKHRLLHYRPDTASKIINTCCVLHNMCTKNGLEEIEPEEGDDPLEGLFSGNISEEEERAVTVSENNLLSAGRNARARIIRRYFT